MGSSFVRERDRFQLIPLGHACFRLEPDSGGRLWGSFVPDPRPPHETDGRPPVRIDDDSQDLQGWLTARADLDGSGSRWVNVLRRPEREASVALLDGDQVLVQLVNHDGQLDPASQRHRRG